MAVVVEVLVFEVSVWTAAVINMAAEAKKSAIDVRADAMRDVLVDVELIVVPAALIMLEFAVSASCSADVLSGVVADALTNAVATGVIMVFVPGISVELLADVNANVF